MPQLIRPTDKRRLTVIRRNGITARAVYSHGKGVFATPVTRNYFLSYQWLRELGRMGIRTVSAVQFHLEDDNEVTIGGYNAEPVTTTAADAVRLFMEHETGLGLEIVIPRSVSRKSIPRIHTPGRSPDDAIIRNPIPMAASPAAARIASVDKSGTGGCGPRMTLGSTRPESLG